MVLKMKARLKERMVELFQDGRSRKKRDEREVTHEELFEEIGRLKVENDWLKKNLPSSVETRRSMIDPGDESLSVSRQCEESRAFPINLLLSTSGRRSRESSIDESH